MADMTVILNPIAGRGAGQRLSPQISARLAEQGLDFEMLSTKGPGHASLLAGEAVERGQPVVVAVGGDGTVNEVLHGLVQALDGSDRTALGVLPIGTGNDFAYAAGLPLGLPEACRVIAEGRTRAIDVGRAKADNEDVRYFGNGVGIGFDAIVNIESRKLQRLRGFAVYLVAVFRTLAFYYHAPLVELTIDGQEIVQPSMMLSIMNGRRFGGGFVMTPQAEMDDGLFDICLMGQVPRPSMVGFVPRFMQGTHITDERVSLSQGQKVRVVSETPWAAHVDGEVYGLGASHYEMELLRQGVRLIC